jgi:uncharacterized protein (TIGR00251 family)
LVLQVVVQPGAKQDEIAGMHGERLKLRIKAPAIEGRANDHLVEFLAELFGVSRAAIRIVRGTTSRMKTVQIDRPQHLPTALQSLTRS